MNKMNKKGFTLIEMLVVIAIIAVLVAIIIPTVSSATVKASAATNAANLRSYKAAVTTAYLSGALAEPSSSGVVSNLTDVETTAPEAKEMDGKFKTSTSATVYFDATKKEFTVYFVDNNKNYTIKSFSDVAEDGGSLTDYSIGTVAGEEEQGS